MKKIVLASKNKGKIKEFKEILQDTEIVPYGELGITEEPEETGKTFYENALIKAKTIALKTGLPTVSDDSGICVDYLSGAPGIYSARYSGDENKETMDKSNRDKLLTELTGVKDRDAKFCSSVVLFIPDETEGKIISGYGETKGYILDKETGENGFGYDCIFYSYDLEKCFGLATEKEKNSVSHRARAIADLKSKIKTGKE